MATVIGIFISPEKGAPMQALKRAEAIAHVGLQGDRYATGRGSYSNLLNKRFRSGNGPASAPIRHITLTSRNALDEANKELRLPFLPIETRRNLLVDNISADDLLGFIDMEFAVGAVRMRGIEDCIPCAIPGMIVKKAGFVDAFANCGGLRAEILTSGWIGIGDSVGYRLDEPQ